MTLSRNLAVAGFLVAIIAVALRFTVLLIEDADERQLVTNLAIAAAAIATTLLSTGALCAF